MLENVIAEQNQLLAENNKLLAQLIKTQKILASLTDAVEAAKGATADFAAAVEPEKDEAGPTPTPGATLEEAVPPTVEDVKAALVALTKSRGKRKAVELVESYGAKKVGELAAEAYAEIIAKAKEQTDA